MKAIYSIIFLFTLNFAAVSQIVDTCEYVNQNNQIGGLDCHMCTLAPFTADSYQWLNCDSLYAPIPGDTTDTYSGMAGSVNVALVVTYLGCTDTSQCQPTCIWGVEELTSKHAELIKIADQMGRETEDKPNTLLLYIFSDGTTKKVFRVE
jgi:hypothetical protein